MSKKTKGRKDSSREKISRESAEAYVTMRKASPELFEGTLYSAWDLPTAAHRISTGLPTVALETVQERLALSNKELAEVVLISPRTLTRRKKERTLPPDESERVYRISRLVEIAAEILGGPAEARDWMKEPNFALGDEAPLSLAKTEPGARMVERVLHQIEHGITV